MKCKFSIILNIIIPCHQQFKQQTDTCPTFKQMFVVSAPVCTFKQGDLFLHTIGTPLPIEDCKRCRTCYKFVGSLILLFSNVTSF